MHISSRLEQRINQTIAKLKTDAQTKETFLSRSVEQDQTWFHLFSNLELTLFLLRTHLCAYKNEGVRYLKTRHRGEKKTGSFRGFKKMWFCAYISQSVVTNHCSFNLTPWAWHLKIVSKALCLQYLQFQNNKHRGWTDGKKSFLFFFFFLRNKEQPPI